MKTHAYPDHDFFKSAMDLTGRMFDLDGFDAWFDGAMARHRFVIERIPFLDLLKWRVLESGDIAHESGKFFTIEGIEVESNFGSVAKWRQPIINQPEIGFLGFITKRIGGVLHFLMQAKMEPGNIRCIQLAPTLQATRSNYTRVHQGKSPPFLEYFRDNPDRRVLVDVLQSEQGGRFLRKRNRNIIIEVDEGEDLNENEDYIWLTLGQVRELLKRDNVINMDARTVLSCISYHRGMQGRSEEGENGQSSLHSMDEILSWFTEMKCQYELNIRSIPLREADPWQRDEERVFHPYGGYFEVIAVRVEADNREVASWTQPIVRPCREGIIAFVAREFAGQTHVLVQGKVEAGNFDTVEMAPTVQCLTGDFRRVPPERRPPFLDFVLNVAPEQILFDAKQSEEGGRFFREENRNLVVMADDSFPSDLPPNYMWVSTTQMRELIRFNNIVNIQARCLLSVLPPGLA